jgi:signal peptidase I
MSRRALDLGVGLVLPLGVTLAGLTFLIPSSMEGGSRGALAWLARVGDEEPLLVGIVLFATLATVARHWLRVVDDRVEASGFATEAGAVRSSRISRSSKISARFILGLAALAGAVLLARASLADLHRVTGASMMPTLKTGDRLLVNKLAYGLRLPFSSRVLGPRPPRRGDLVVFPNRGRVADAPSSLVKRVVGLPGDVIAYRDGTLSVNGWAVPSCDAGPFLAVAGGAMVRGRVGVEVLEDRAYLTLRSSSDETVLADFEVPPGEVFVVGDDRLASSDSRTWNGGRGGGVPVSSLEGRVSRLAFGRLREGRLDLAHPFVPLGLSLREPRVDVRKLEERIAACVAHRPASSRPPAVK